MMRTATIRLCATAAAVVVMLTSSGNAATVSASTLDFNSLTAPFQNPLSFGGFQFAPARVVNGNCSAGNCLGLNQNETTTMTRIGGGSFSLASFWFQMLGRVNTLTIQGSNGNTITLGPPDYAKNTGYTWSDPLKFANVTSVVFSVADGGNTRIDDIGVSVATVPAPAAFGMLSLALGGLGLLRRRKLAAA